MDFPDGSKVVDSILEKGPQFLEYVDGNWGWMIPVAFGVLAIGYLMGKWRKR